MKKCVAASVFITSPPFSDDQQRRILGLIGEMAEGVIGRDYLLNEVKHPAWAPLPPALDFHDANKGFASKSQYLSFIFRHNPNVDRTEAERILQRAIPGPDGQILCIPDFMSQESPQQERFYEVKPDSAEGTREADKKMAFVDGFMQSLGLPYRPGVSWKPDKQFPFFTGIVFFTLVTISFHYERHKTIQGVVVYHFCIETRTLIPLRLLLFILALIIIAILFPEIPFPDPPPGLPIPSPIPIPIPQPVPVPAVYALCGQVLEGSVGQGGANNRDDVELVQLLLNGWMEASKKPALAIDGVAGPRTIAAITSFQREYTPAFTSGRIEPGGPSLFQLGEMTLSQVQRKAPRSSVILERPYKPLGMPGFDMRVLLWKLLEESL
jgi:hypothetical protein